MKRGTTAFSAILLFIGTGLLLAEIHESKTLYKRAALAKGKTVVLENRNGNVTVTGWSKDSLDVVAEVEVRSRRRSELEKTLENIRIRIEPKADRLVIEADSPEFEGGSGFWESDANLETANGNVRAEGVQGRLRLGSTNGNVEAADVQGAVDASTTNGNVEVMCGNLKADDRISCRTTNGDATAIVSEKTEAEVELSTVNGQVHCDLPVTVQGGISDKRIHGRIGQGGCKIHLSTVNGNVRLSKE
jgi:hypothetical protein